MKGILVVAAFGALFVSTAAAVVAPEATRVTYVLDTPLGVVEVTCEGPLAAAAPVSATTSFPVGVDGALIFIGAQASECDFAPASE